jgi:hypothetical protein
MSDFLMVVPDGWAEVTDGQAFVDQQTEAQLLDLLSYGNLAAIEAMLQDGGHIPMTAAMADFRMFRDGGAYRVWYLLG